MRSIRLVRKQLVIFWTASVVAAVVLGVVFLRVPEALGIDRYEVVVELDRAAGLYEGAEVTYRGHPVGKVASLELGEDRIRVRLRLVDEVAVPADVTAEVHSRSAVGEQYVALVPTGSSTNAPSLADGDLIPVDRTEVPVEIGPVLDNVSALAVSIDSRNLDVLLRETSRSLVGRTGDLQQILDEGGGLIALADQNFGPTAQLIRHADPLLTTVNGSADHVASLTGNLAQVTAELRAGDADLRRLLADGPGFAQEATALVDDLGRSLPPFLAALDPVTGVLSDYSPYLASILSLYPRSVATVQSVTKPDMAGAFVRLTLANAADPPECTEGFTPPEDRSSPFDLSPKRVPLVYCTAAADDPRAVRGARNVPCPGHPAIRRGDASLCP